MNSVYMLLLTYKTTKFVHNSVPVIPQLEHILTTYCNAAPYAVKDGCCTYFLPMPMNTE